MQKVRPKKALGQHFLTDESVARRIAATLEPVSTLPVLEVGPGMGMLTHCLLDMDLDLRVAEIDTESVAYLRSEYPKLAHEDRIIEGDFLRMDLDTVFPAAPKISVIGNYPYNISSQIFFHILDFRDKVQCCSGMLQREVAERIAAPAGCKARGILSVLIQAWYDVEYLFTVSETVFNPPPKVKSGVIRLTRNATDRLPCDEVFFRKVVKATFGQRRKMLRNTVRQLIPPGAALPESPLLSLRPEDLSVQQFIELTTLIANLTPQRQ